MSQDYREYLEFVNELKTEGVTGEELAHIFATKFDYLAEDEVSIIFSDLNV